MARKGRYADEHILAAIAYKRSSFSEFMQSILAENIDRRFFYHIDHLLMVIYEHHQNGKYITKSQACRLIPIGHTNTCKKYVEEAQARGYVRFEPDRNDARRVRVIPTEELLTYVRDQIEKSIDQARELVGRVSDVRQLPRDNHPLAEYPNG
jgi:hypothetical protein